MNLEFTHYDETVSVTLARNGGEFVATVARGKQTREARGVAVTARDGGVSFRIGARAYTAYAAQKDDVHYVWINGRHYELKEHSGEVERAAHDAPGGDGNISVPMPGNVVRVLVKAGDAVEKGATLLVIESMKMENAVTAPFGGVVEQVNAEPGKLATPGTVVVKLNKESK